MRPFHPLTERDRERTKDRSKEANRPQSALGYGDQVWYGGGDGGGGGWEGISITRDIH